MDTRKTILWIEDFANEPVIPPEDYDPITEFIPDRTAQIRDTFPDYLVDHVQVIEDPTKIPNFMEINGNNYELVLIDINFENGISQDPEEQYQFISELQRAQVEISDLTPNTVKKLGYSIFYYLLSRWNIPCSKMAFLSAYCNEDDVNGLFARTFSGAIKPNHFDKRDVDRFTKYLDEHFSPDSITAHSAISQVKDLFHTWSCRGISDDSILYRNGNHNDSPDARNNTILRIKQILDSERTSRGQYAFEEILRAVVYPFEAKSKSSERDWSKAFYELLKELRNLFSHRSTINNQLAPIDFLVITDIGLRAVFDSTSQPTGLLESEKWLIKCLEKSIEAQGIASQLSESQINIRIEEKMLQWYLAVAQKAGCLGEGYSMLRSQKAMYTYSLEDVLHLICIRAQDALLLVQPSIMSSNTLNNAGGINTTFSPTLKCFFQSDSNKMRKDRSGYEGSHIPTAIRDITRAYILYHIELATSRPNSLKICP